MTWGQVFLWILPGVRYANEDLEEQDGEAESQLETHKAKKKPKTAPAPSPGGTQCAQATPASSSGTVGPSGRGMNTVVKSFFTIPGGNTQSQNSRLGLGLELCHCQACCRRFCQASC